MRFLVDYFPFVPLAPRFTVPLFDELAQVAISLITNLLELNNFQLEIPVWLSFEQLGHVDELLGHSHLDPIRNYI